MQAATDLARFILDNLAAFLILWLLAAAFLALAWHVIAGDDRRPDYAPDLYPDCDMCRIEAQRDIGMAAGDRRDYGAVDARPWRRLVQHQVSVHGRVRW